MNTLNPYTLNATKLPAVAMVAIIAQADTLINNTPKDLALFKANATIKHLQLASVPDEVSADLYDAVLMIYKSVDEAPFYADCFYSLLPKVVPTPMAVS